MKTVNVIVKWNLLQIMPTSTSKNVQYVPPETVNGFFAGVNKKAQKRANNVDKPVDVPLEQRLENLIVDVPSTTTAPTSDSLVHLLLQVNFINSAIMFHNLDFFLLGASARYRV